MVAAHKFFPDIPVPRVPPPLSKKTDRFLLFRLEVAITFD
jgi:hypothetical protein